MKNKTAEQIHLNQTDIFDFMGADNGIHSKSSIAKPRYKLCVFYSPFSYRLPQNKAVQDEHFHTFEDAYHEALKHTNRDIHIYSDGVCLVADFHV